MSDFTDVTLESVVKRVKVGFVGSIEKFYCEKESGVLLLRTLNLTSKGIDYSDLKYVTKEFFEKNKKSQIKKGDILIARHGDNGKACVYERDELAQALNVVVIEPDEEKMSTYLLLYFFEIPYVKQQISGSIGGSVQGVINTQKIAELLLPFSKAINYKKVEEFIQHIDNKRKINDLINKEIEAMARTIYYYWFLQFDFPDENGRPYKSSGGKMVWNEELKREIPKGWKVKSIFDCMDTTYGLPLSTNYFNESEGIPVVRIRDILQNTFSAFTTEKVSEQYLTLSKDLLVGMDGNFHMNFWAKEGDCINQRIFRIRDKENISALQVYYEIAPYIKAREENVARSTVGHLSDKDFRALRIMIPNQKSIYETFDMLLTKMCSNKAENQELASLRDYLLPLLMNGQVGFKES